MRRAEGTRAGLATAPDAFPTSVTPLSPLPRLGCSYECPWDGLAAPYRPPARLLVCIDSEGDRANGVRLTQAGLEFSADQSFIGGKTRVRAAGLITM